MRWLKTSALAAAMAAPSAPLDAGPWSPGSGQSYQQASTNVVTLDDRDEYAFSYYGEFGLGRGWAFIGSIPIRFADAQRDRPSGLPGEDFFALTPTAGLRYQFLSGPLVLAAQSDLGLPLTGGAFDLTNQLLAGTTLFRGRVFLQAGGGFRLRTEDAGHEALWSADGGVWIGSSVLAVVSGRGRYQVEADPRAGRAESENRVGTQWLYRFNGRIDVGVELLYTFENDSVSDGLSTTAYIAFWTGL